MERWDRLVSARLEEVAALRDPIDADHWDSTAERFAARIGYDATDDPLFLAVRDEVDADTVLLDVGCGPGRFALTLAPHVGQVVAIDQSARMLELLEAEAGERGLDNVTTRRGRFEELTGLAADVTVCSYVLPLIDDVGPFGAALRAATRRRGFVYLNAMSNDALLDAFWRRFHGRPRRPAPTYLDAVDVLTELGLDAVASVVQVEPVTRFASLEEAVDDHLRLLALSDEPAVRTELAAVLDPWLVREDGALRAPLGRYPAAIISWSTAC